MNPGPSPLDTRAHQASWDANAASWIVAVRTRALPSRHFTDQALLQRIASRPWQSLLDLGCGEGWLLRRLAEQPGVRLFGVDGCAALIEAAAAAQADACYACAEYAALESCPQLADQRFDWVVCNFALFGAAEDAAALRVALARLAPEGRLLIQTLPGEDAGALRCECFSALPGCWTPMPYRLRSDADWQQLITAAGGTLADTTTVHDCDGHPLSVLMEVKP